MGAVGLEVDLGADREDRSQIDEAARLPREDLELSDDISHCKGCLEFFRGKIIIGGLCARKDVSGNERLEVGSCFVLKE